MHRIESYKQRYVYSNPIASNEQAYTIEKTQ